MSIEIDLGRIATSLEVIVKHLTADKQPPSIEKPMKGTKASKEVLVPKAEPVVEAAQEVDPFNQDEPASIEVSFETLSAELKKHSVKYGVKTTIALMIKHGADSSAPKINTIPQANYVACYQEVLADLKKDKKG